MKGILRTLGRIGKGAGTVVGTVVTGGGVALGGGDTLARCFEEVAKLDAGALALLGVALAVFGFGRKAGWVGARPDA